MKNMSERIPTERKIFRTIYDMYLPVYPNKNYASGDVLISIDIERVAKQIGCSKELLFGYLYYYTEYKHGYERGDTKVVMFTPKFGEQRNGINFPYLTAVLADHDTSHRWQFWTLIMSVVALVLSIVAIATGDA